ncbi:MAG TPA: M1 family metallopeptidase [Lutibacter sp.]
MKKILLITIFFLTVVIPASAQETQPQKAHYNLSKFKQIDEELPTPNNEHKATGAPGHEYTQQQVDYKMDILLDEEKNRIYGEETITYHNNSKDDLTYLWIQLDQNMMAPDSKSPDVRETKTSELYTPKEFSKNFIQAPFDGGFKIDFVKNLDGSDASYLINQTMMRLDLDKPLVSGGKYSFKIKWWHNINNHLEQGGRSGFEHFPDGNNDYIIAQFYPRLAVYNNVEGWQNLQFWGSSEFALEFGNFEVNITTPKDHILASTGVLKNPEEVLSKLQLNRLEQAKKSFDNPVIIVTQKEAEETEKGRSKETKTSRFYAENVRDFAFASSRKYIWDGMAVDINGRTVMAYSYYPKEGNPLWEQHSTRAVASTLKTYSRFTFDYPYHQAISVHAEDMGMEYPQISFNRGRPNPDGTYSDFTKYRMLGVIIHEVGHNFFPMIVNSDERQWTWMDEGLNSFVQMLAQMDYEKGYPLSRGLPKNIVGYMQGDQSKLTPIITQGDHLDEFSNNAYAKPAAGLYMLRQVIMGPEMFDHAFKTYAQRWKFKHPTPADFFRTMEDASAMDLDWFWRGWFYSTGANDIGIKEVKKYYVTDKPTERAQNMAKRRGIDLDKLPPALYLISEDSPEFKSDLKSKKPEDYNLLSDYINTNFSSEEKTALKAPKYFYELVFEKPGDLVMPIVVEFEYEDGTKERKQYPAEIWRNSDAEVTKVFPSSKAISKITLDPDEQTADVNLSNNSWPKKTENKFEQFKKEQIKG